MSDLNLSLEAFRNGDHSAYNKFYHTYYGDIFSFVCNLAKDYQEAQDITLVTFLKLWIKRASFENVPNIRAFLYVTSRHACIDYFRGKQKRKKMEEQMWYLLEEDESTKDLAFTIEMLPILYDMLQILPEQQRSVIKMWLEGYSFAAIAEKLNISLNQVGVQKHNGIGKLKKIIP